MDGKRKVSKAENLGDETCLVSYLSFESKLLSVSVLVVSKKKKKEKKPSAMHWKFFRFLFFCKKVSFYDRDGNRKKIKKIYEIRYRIFTVCCLNKAVETCFIFTQF